MSARSTLIPTLAYWFLGLVWGSNFIFMKYALEVISPFQIVFFRVLFGFLPVAIFAAIKGQFKKAHLRYIGHFFVMANLAAAVYYYLFVKGTALLPSGIAGAVSGAIPLFAFILAVIFIKEERLTWRKGFGVTVGVAGVLLVARPTGADLQSGSLEGVIYLIFGSLILGASFVYARKFIAPLQIPTAALTTYQLGLATLLAGLVTDFTGSEVLWVEPKALYGLTIGLGLLGTGLAFILYYYIVNKLGAVTASSVTFVPPVVALAIGVFILHESIGIWDYVATALIFAGVFLLRQKNKP